MRLCPPRRWPQRGDGARACLFGSMRAGSHARLPVRAGCVSAGSTLGEAVLGAHEALAGHVALMVADGDALPEPTPLEAVAAQRDASTVAITLVPVTLPGKAQRIDDAHVLAACRARE